MFLRRHRKRAAGETYEYWTLCESRRTAAGPWQQVVATLGKLTGEAPLEAAGWEQLEPGAEEVPWPTVAAVLSVARFRGQRSELGIAERWYAHSALEDLLGVSWGKNQR